MTVSDLFLVSSTNYFDQSPKQYSVLTIRNKFAEKKNNNNTYSMYVKGQITIHVFE